MTVSTAGQRIAELQKLQAITLAKIPGGGSLEARRMNASLVMLYWRYTREKRTERITIGHYDSSAPPKSITPTKRGYSVAAAIEAARDLAKKNRETPGGLRAERERQAAEQQAAAAAQAALQEHTLKALCLDYVAWLKKQQKPSWYDANNILTNHVIEAHPEIALKPAAAVDKREIVTMVRKLTEAGKETTGRKLRSYLRAAYTCAVKADSDARLPSSFIAYGVLTNPVEATAAIRGTTDKNPLPAAELRKYWKALGEGEGVIGAALRLHVVTGGQRPAQLVRLRAPDDISRFTIRLLDTKGKRSEAREHLIPLTKEISAELAKLPSSGFVLSTDGGKTSMHPTSLSTWAQGVAERAKIADFQLKRVRSGIETLLAQARVDKHIRGQLQSHGIGGVQDSSYDAHTYLPEKREALQVLYRLLKAPMAKRAPKNVSPMRRSAK